MTYEINVALLPLLLDKLNTFKKKFEKYGEGAVVFGIGEQYIDEKTNEKKVSVSVEGAYKVSGYKFVASLEWDENQKCNLIKKSSEDVFVPEIYRTRTECDHCHTDRNRKKTILLHNDESGEYVQVGKQCVKDYLGRDVESYARYLSIWETMDEYFENLDKIGFGGRLARVYSVGEILEQTVEFVRERGYISKKQSYEYNTDSTSSMVWDAINECRDFKTGELYYEKKEVTEEGKARVAQVKEFIENYDTTDNDYAHNLQVLLRNKCVEAENFGLVVSAVGFVIREEHKHDEKKDKPKSEWVGKVDERIEFTSTPVCVTSYDTEFGTIHIYKMMVGDDIIIWKTSKWLDDSAEVTIKATVKEHSEYRGDKQTVITRGKVIA